MGLCRSLLYVLGAFAIPREIDTSGTLILGLIALAAFIHTIALSLIARDECHVLISACPECAYPVEEETSICSECGALATEEAITAQNTWSHQTKNIFFALGTFALACPSGLALLALLLTLGTDVGGGAWPLTGVALAFLLLVWWLVWVPPTTLYIAAKHPRLCPRRHCCLLPLRCIDIDPLAHLWLGSCI